MTKTISRSQSVLNTFGVVLIIWSLYRFNFTNIPEWFDELVAKPLVFILPVYLYIKRVEHKPFFQQLWFSSARIMPDILIGLGLGLVFVSSAFLANFIRFGELSILSKFSSSEFLFAMGLTFATAFSEEIFARGFVLKRLYEEWDNVYSAAFISSILFLVIHIPILITNLQLKGTLLLLFFATDFILSLVNSFIYIERRSLVGPILIHALYNTAILLYL